MSKKVLHLLSQRPMLTGSGVTLDALVRNAARTGWEQRVVCGVPANDPLPQVGGLLPEQIQPLFFNTGELNFPVPGMSDVMPYPSTVWSTMTETQLQTYRHAWRQHLQNVLANFYPDVIHVHHVWLLSSLIKDVAPKVPVVNQCHATGLRQMILCPHLAKEVQTKCSRNEQFVVLHRGHATELAQALSISPQQITVVGAGYRQDVFYTGQQTAGGNANLLYIGKYSAAKGLPWLLDAVERLAADIPGLTLHVAGSGAGQEAEALRQRMESMFPAVVLHGQLNQPKLATLMRDCAVCVLPSFYEGVPLVLVEALACGCRLVATKLPGVVDQLAPHLDETLELVPLPRLAGIDSPEPEDLPAFVNALTAAIKTSLDKPPLSSGDINLTQRLLPFTWKTVFGRVEKIWQTIL